MLSETDLSGNFLNDYVFFGGRKIARVRDSDGTIFHYFANHLGSSRVIVQYGQNAACYDADFGPYGKESAVTNTCAQNYKFTGKERDTETGNDYFGTRFFENNLGRFMSPDPVMTMRQEIFNPQQWNIYSYARNNPLRFKDEHGKWPKEIHDLIIDRAFPGLSVAQRNQLKRVSVSMDGIAGQTQAHNYEHAMGLPGENATNAKEKIEQNIQKHEQAAQRAQGGTPEHASQINGSAMNEFAQALHPVADRTSPAHTDADGNSREWAGLPVTPSAFDAVDKHKREESMITQEQMDNAVKDARDAFGKAFRQQALLEAELPMKPKEKK